MFEQFISPEFQAKRVDTENSGWPRVHFTWWHHERQHFYTAWITPQNRPETWSARARGPILNWGIMDHETDAAPFYPYASWRWRNYYGLLRAFDTSRNRPRTSEQTATDWWQQRFKDDFWGVNRDMQLEQLRVRPCLTPDEMLPIGDDWITDDHVEIFNSLRWDEDVPSDISSRMTSIMAEVLLDYVGWCDKCIGPSFHPDKDHEICVMCEAPEMGPPNPDATPTPTYLYQINVPGGAHQNTLTNLINLTGCSDVGARLSVREVEEINQPICSQHAEGFNTIRADGDGVHNPARQAILDMLPENLRDHQEQCGACGVNTCGCLSYPTPENLSSIDPYNLGQLCPNCWDRCMRLCPEHDDWVPTVSMSQWGMCDSCARDQNLRGIESWDYTPDLVFWPEPTGTEKDRYSSLYLGLELEMSCRDVYPDNATAAKILKNFDPDLAYIKYDSSVDNGFELVTHPMHPDWALREFPFHALQRAIDDQIIWEDDESCGLHIHMSREAFTPVHLWKLLQFHSRLSSFCGRIGGRGTSSEWGHFSGDFTMQRKNLLQVVKKKGGIHDYDRYVAVNLRNDYTIELRYPAGGVSPTNVRKLIEWAKAIYLFTDELTMRDVKEGALDDFSYFSGWIWHRKDTYPNLFDQLDEFYNYPKDLPGRDN